jgi:hypothetical protein
MAEVGKSWTILKSVQRSKGINTQGEIASQAKRMDEKAVTLQSMPKEDV